MKRKVFLALALFALMAVGVYAQTEADFEVSVGSDGKLVILGYKGSAKEISIPAKIQNKTVIRVFLENNKNITKVTLPNGVEEFQFSNFSSLISVNIPNSVTKLSGSDFEGCTSLTTVTIPDSVTSIGASAFDGCAKLTSVTFSGQIPLNSFYQSSFATEGDIYDKYFAAGGGAGTYTRPSGGTTWTKK